MIFQACIQQWLVPNISTPVKITCYTTETYIHRGNNLQEGEAAALAAGLSHVQSLKTLVLRWELWTWIWKHANSIHVACWVDLCISEVELHETLFTSDTITVTVTYNQMFYRLICITITGYDCLVLQEYYQKLDAIIGIALTMEIQYVLGTMLTYTSWQFNQWTQQNEINHHIFL